MGPAFLEARKRKRSLIWSLFLLFCLLQRTVLCRNIWFKSGEWLVEPLMLMCQCLGWHVGFQGLLISFNGSSFSLFSAPPMSLPLGLPQLPFLCFTSIAYKLAWFFYLLLTHGCLIFSFLRNKLVITFHDSLLYFYLCICSSSVLPIRLS